MMVDPMISGENGNDIDEVGSALTRVLRLAGYTASRI